jgi:WD40 repeat protein
MSPDGAVFVVIGDGGAVTLWDTATGKRLRQLCGDDGKDRSGPGAPWIRATLAFSTDNQFVASAGRGERDIRVWEVQTGKLVQTLKGHKEPVSFLTFSGKGRRLVSAGHDGQTVRFWDLATAKEWRPAATLPGADCCIRAVSADGQTWALTGERKSNPFCSLRIREIETGKEILHLEKAGLCAFAPDGRTVAIQSASAPEPEEEVGESTIQVIELATGGVRTQFRGHSARLETLVYSLDSKVLASGSSDNTALLWDLLGQGSVPPGPLPARQLPALWDRLAGDPATAYSALCTLSAKPEQTVAWVREHVTRIEKADGKQVASLLKDLDDEAFSVREAAATALKRLGVRAVAALRETLDGNPGAEVRRRVTELLEQIDQERNPEQLRSSRAIEVLERLETPEARKVLEDLAKGVSQARQTQEAKAALERLARKQRGDS